MSVVPSGAPQNFTAIGVSPTSVQLQWDHPTENHRHGTIVLYEVVYHQRARPLDDFATNCSELTTLVEGLEPNTDYSFQLRAYTSKGPGPWNNRLPFRTFGSCTYIHLQLCRTYIHSTLLTVWSLVTTMLCVSNAVNACKPWNSLFCLCAFALITSTRCILFVCL